MSGTEKSGSNLVIFSEHLRFFNASSNVKGNCFTFAGHYNSSMSYQLYIIGSGRRILIAALIMMVLSCTQNQAHPVTTNQVSDDSLVSGQKTDKPALDTLNDGIASVFSGLPPLNGCTGLSSEKGWITYQQHINSDWKLVEKNKTGPISRWRVNNLDTISSRSATLFYPFAGADFLYAHAFFPEVSNYILIGLEPVGKLHTCNTMSKKDFISYLEEIRNSLYYSNQLGFFRTKSMETDLNQESLDGTLPLILFYIRKTGHHISGISYFTLDKKGGIVSVNQDSTTYGVRIAFFDSSDQKQQVLYYLSYDLSDKNLLKHPELLQFVKSFGNQECFLKAASYLMFTGGFHVMRNYILEQELSVLQDDSGIPYRFFKSSGWTVKLFGTYTKTIDMFKYKFQPDLQSAYEKQTTKLSVPFRIGYNVKFNETNLLFAKKKH